MDKLAGKLKINSIKSVGFKDKNPFSEQQAVGDFWGTINNSVSESNFPWNGDIQDQIHKIQLETEEYKSILANPQGQSLNLLG